MKKFYTEPSMDVKNFEAENIITASGDVGTLDSAGTVTEGTAAVKLTYGTDFEFVF